LAREFVLVRLVNARGVNLNVFDFDYDLVWAGFFMNADERIYGRFGGRDADSPENYLTAAGLKYAMRAALVGHFADSKDQLTTPRQPLHTVDQYPAAKRLKQNACIHCHQVYDFERQQSRAEGKWLPDQVWVYPAPQNIGMTLDVDQGNRVRAVASGSPADRSGLRPGDVLKSVNGRRVASFADVQYALHLAPMQGHIPLAWERDGATKTAELELAAGWRKTDISWRASTRSLGPSPCVHGEDLSAQEKRALGLDESQLAFRQGNFVSRPAQQAGIRQNDIIVGIDDKHLEMSAKQFDVFVRSTTGRGTESASTFSAAEKACASP
jgi:predicted metalloprotease with PDZ domain